MAEPRRLLSCIAQWPDCGSADYHPSCCRFPKSCSCYATEGKGGVTAADLEPAPEFSAPEGTPPHESILDLANALVASLRATPAFWDAFQQVKLDGVIPVEPGASERVVVIVAKGEHAARIAEAYDRPADGKWVTLPCGCSERKPPTDGAR